MLFESEMQRNAEDVYVNWMWQHYFTSIDVTYQKRREKEATTKNPVKTSKGLGKLIF